MVFRLYGVYVFSPSGTRRISFDEFLPIFQSASQKKRRGGVEDFVEGLRVFDRDGNGQVSAAELRHVLSGLGKSEDKIYFVFEHGYHLSSYSTFLSPRRNSRLGTVLWIQKWLRRLHSESLTLPLHIARDFSKYGR